MPEHVYPGVYVEEISTGPKPIEGVSTSIAGFVGPTERGPQNARYITSWHEYQRWFGDHLGIDVSYLSYAIQGFFDNGGQRCFVARIAAATATHASYEATPGLTVTAIGAGLWGNRLFVRVQPATLADANQVRLQVAYYAPNSSAPTSNPEVFEDYDNLNLDPNAANSLLTTLNSNSKLVRVALTGNPTSLATMPDFVPCVGGTDGTLTVADYEGNEAAISDNAALFGRARGLQALAQIDEVSLLLAPDEVRIGTALSGALVAQCERMKDRFGILATPFDFDVGHDRPSHDTSYAAQYYPWIVVYDSHTRRDQVIPPSGHIAGIFARTDLELGVHKPPANAVVIGAKGLQKPVSKGDQDLLNPIGINCLRDFRADGRGLRVWGARTMSSDPEWKYISVRRLFVYIQESIVQGTQWVVFEPNTEPTWGRVVQAIASFLMAVWRAGALQGNKPDEAFFVKCDRTTMTQDDIDQGRLICYVGLAPVKPAEYVIFRIGQQSAEAP